MNEADNAMYVALGELALVAPPNVQSLAEKFRSYYWGYTKDTAGGQADPTHEPEPGTRLVDLKRNLIDAMKADLDKLIQLADLPGPKSSAGPIP